MKKINEMTLEELHEAEDILNSLLDHPMSDTAREWYAHQANKILEAIYEKDPAYKDFKAWADPKVNDEPKEVGNDDAPFPISEVKQNQDIEPRDSEHTKVDINGGLHDIHRFDKIKYYLERFKK